MKRILLFITATLLLASGTSCSDDNTNFDPIGDELGIPYKDGHDVYGVEVLDAGRGQFHGLLLIDRLDNSREKTQLNRFGGFPRSEKKIISIGIIQLLLQ